jgi:hypothetical protein
MPLDWTGIIVERDFYAVYDLFDEERTRTLGYVRFRNHVRRRCYGSMTVMSGYRLKCSVLKVKRWEIP